MSVPAILDWANKVNTPDVEAMLQQYAVTHKLTAEEINQLRDRVNWLLQNYTQGIDPAVTDLAAFLNASENPFVRHSNILPPTNTHIVSLVNYWNHNTSGFNFLRTNRASGGFNAPTINNINIGSQTITTTDISNNASFFITQEAMILNKFSFEKLITSGSNRQYFVSIKAYQRSLNSGVINVIDVADINADFGANQLGPGFFSTTPEPVVIPADYMVTLFIRRGELSSGFDVSANITLYFKSYVS